MLWFILLLLFVHFLFVVLFPLFRIEYPGDHRLGKICPFGFRLCCFVVMGQLMRLWFLLHRRPAKAQASLRIRAVSPGPYAIRTHEVWK